jgi:hypothetical protein
MLVEPLNNRVVQLFFVRVKLFFVPQSPDRVKDSEFPPGVLVDVRNHEP